MAAAKAAVLLGSAMVVLGGAAGRASAAEMVAFRNIDADRCFMFSQLLTYRMESGQAVELPFNLVINDQADYRKLFDPKLLRQSCASLDPAKAAEGVDFATTTVLGLWSSGSCAATGFKKRVVRDDAARTITYTVRVVEQPISCSAPGLEGLNLIAIPKLPAGYKVIFRNERD